jgi:putative FmdB family regulatory protein
VPAVVRTAEGAEAIGRPGDDMRGARRDLLPAAGAHVRLRRRRACDRPDPPVPVRVLLEPTAAVDEPRLEVVPDGRPRRRAPPAARRSQRAAPAAARAVAAGHDVKCRGRDAQWPAQADPQRDEEGTVPRYDVRCRACGTTFEVNRPMARADEPAACPHGHDDTVRLLPTVGLTGRAGTVTSSVSAPAASGGCCGGACCG